MSAIVVDVDPGLYGISAVKKAAYRLADRSFVAIEVVKGGPIRVTLTPKSGTVASADLEGSFRNELLDQELRETIAEETRRVRNLLLAHAFSGLLPSGEAMETADFRDDPAGIARSQADGL